MLAQSEHARADLQNHIQDIADKVKQDAAQNRAFHE